MHSRGLIHLDIKPSNILVRLSGWELSLLLSDFGSAQDLDKPTSLEFTRKYAALEVSLAHKVTTASDAYSLSLTIREGFEAQSRVYPELRGLTESQWHVITKMSSASDKVRPSLEHTLQVILTAPCCRSDVSQKDDKLRTKGEHLGPSSESKANTEGSKPLEGTRGQTSTSRPSAAIGPFVHREASQSGLSDQISECNVCFCTNAELGVLTNSTCKQHEKFACSSIGERTRIPLEQGQAKLEVLSNSKCDNASTSQIQSEVTPDCSTFLKQRLTGDEERASHDRVRLSPGTPSKLRDNHKRNFTFKEEERNPSGLSTPCKPPGNSREGTLSCMFWFLDCRFSTKNPIEWLRHGLSHFGRAGPPREVRRSVCFQEFTTSWKLTSVDGEAAWVQSTKCVYKHGIAPSVPNVDADLLRYLWQFSIISTQKFHDLQAKYHAISDANSVLAQVNNGEENGYRRLRSWNSEIRLVTLELAPQSEGPLMCTMSTHSLHDAPSYVALSYVWGSPIQ